MPLFVTIHENQFGDWSFGKDPAPWPV